MHIAIERPSTKTIPVTVEFDDSEKRAISSMGYHRPFANDTPTFACLLANPTFVTMYPDDQSALDAFVKLHHNIRAVKALMYSATHALHDANDARGFRVVSLTDQSCKGIEPFLQRTPIKGIVGAGSESAADYGVRAIPHTFLIGRDGKLLWQGNPSEGGLEERVEDALARK